MSAKFNVPATYYAKTGRSLFGESLFATGVPVMVGIIKMLDQAMPSPIRSEASTSHGRVDEDTGQAMMLFPVGSPVALYDRVDAVGFTLEVIAVFPRYDMLGRLDHIRVTLRNLAV